MATDSLAEMGMPTLAVDRAEHVVPSARTTEAPRLRDLYLRSPASRPPLRIGLLLDTAVCQSFVGRVVDDILHSNFARLDFVVYNAAARPRPARRASLPARLWRLLGNRTARRLLLYDAYLRVDTRRAAIPDDPLAPVDCGPVLAEVPSLEVAPIVKGFTHRLTAADVERIRDRELDVLLRFGFNILRGEILGAARYGVWSFHHDDNDEYRGGPAGFWELRERNPISGVMLQVLTEDLDAGLVLCKSRFRTAPGLSLARNRYGPYWGSTHFVIRKLRELHQHGWEHVASRADPAAPYRGRRATYRRPTNGEMVRFLVPGLVKAALGRLAPAPASRPAGLAIRIAGRALPQDADTSGLRGFSWIDVPRGHSWTEPFLIARDGATWAFFQDRPHPKAPAVLACAEVLPGGGFGPVRPCLEGRYDLSYPMVFEGHGEVFMIPGSDGQGAVELYRATRFPFGWKLEKVLGRLNAATTTVYRADGRWWFFVSVAEPPGHCAALLLFHAATLTGEWVYHPVNPISTDARAVRGAGAVLDRGGRRARPAGAVGAGGALTFCEIVELTPEVYRERPLLTAEPALPTGLGTIQSYNECGGIEVVGVSAGRRRWTAAFGKGARARCAASRA